VSRPGRLTYARDIVIFVIGVGIVVQQTGFPWLLDSPDKVNVWSLAVGALFCNGPVMLQALALRFGGGTSQPGPLPQPSPSPLPSEPSPAPSSGGE
jgi:hypothetical protein